MLKIDCQLLAFSFLQSLEDLSTMYDGTVRNSSGGIVQLTYGDDGMDPVCMEAKDGQPVDFSRILMKTKVRFWTHVCNILSQRGQVTLPLIFRS